MPLHCAIRSAGSAERGRVWPYPPNLSSPRLVLGVHPLRCPQADRPEDGCPEQVRTRWVKRMARRTGRPLHYPIRSAAVRSGIGCTRLRRFPRLMLRDGLLAAHLGAQVVDQAQEGARLIGSAALQGVGHGAPGLVHELGRRRGGVELAGFGVILLIAAAPAFHAHTGTEGGQGQLVALADARCALAAR
jgi:hypothetical protein